nr:unnamed protein product [Callosobruchus analis]
MDVYCTIPCNLPAMTFPKHYLRNSDLWANFMRRRWEGIDDDEVLIRLKRLAAEFLPEGWKDWRADISLNEPEVDPQLINKIRFALPTVGIALAFDSKAISHTDFQYFHYSTSKEK